MSLIVEQKSYQNNPMPEGMHEAVIAAVIEKEMPKYGEPGKKEMKAVTRFVNASGQEAARFYTPSLNEKSNLAKDLKAVHGKVPTKLDMNTLVGTQCRVLVTEGVNGKGEPTAKIEKVLKAAPGQNVVAPKQKAPTPEKKAEVESNLEISDEDIPF